MIQSSIIKIDGGVAENIVYEIQSACKFTIF